MLALPHLRYSGYEAMRSIAALYDPKRSFVRPPSCRRDAHNLHRGADDMGQSRHNLGRHALPSFRHEAFMCGSPQCSTSSLRRLQILRLARRRKYFFRPPYGQSGTGQTGVLPIVLGVCLTRSCTIEAGERLMGIAAYDFCLKGLTPPLRRSTRRGIWVFVNHISSRRIYRNSRRVDQPVA
jgi:hypothetical protein